MTSTNSTNDAEMQQHQQRASSAMSDIINNRSTVGCIAHVTFRVRCETLGHGEEVFLIAIMDHSNNNNTELPNTILHTGKVWTIFRWIVWKEKQNFVFILLTTLTIVRWLCTFFSSFSLSDGCTIYNTNGISMVWSISVTFIVLTATVFSYWGDGWSSPYDVSISVCDLSGRCVS